MGMGVCGVGRVCARTHAVALTLITARKRPSSFSLPPPPPRTSLTLVIQRRWCRFPLKQLSVTMPTFERASRLPRGGTTSSKPATSYAECLASQRDSQRHSGQPWHTHVGMKSECRLS